MQLYLPEWFISALNLTIFCNVRLQELGTMRTYEKVIAYFLIKKKLDKTNEIFADNVSITRGYLFDYKTLEIVKLSRLYGSSAHSHWNSRSRSLKSLIERNRKRSQTKNSIVEHWWLKILRPAFIGSWRVGGMGERGYDVAMKRRQGEAGTGRGHPGALHKRAGEQLSLKVEY